MCQICAVFFFGYKMCQLATLVCFPPNFSSLTYFSPCMLRYFPGVVVENTDQNLLTFLLVVVCTPYYINNPYLGE